MLSVNNNLPPKKNKVQKMSTKKETNTKHNSASTKEISKKSHEKVQEKVKLNTRSKKEKKAPSIKTKSTQAKQKKELVHEQPKSMKMNPITHSFVWPPPLPKAPKTEYDDVYKWPCYVSSPKAAVVTGL